MRSSTIPTDPRNALLLECGQHWESSAPDVARQATLLFLRHFGMAEPAFLEEHLEPLRRPPQKVIEVTEVVTIATDDFAFALPVHGLAVVPAAGTRARARRDHRNPHPVRQLRADHADAATEAGRDRGATRSARRVTAPVIATQR